MSTTATYLQELAQQAGLSEDEKAALGKVLANPKFVDEVGKGVARQSDYSRNMDEVKTLKQSVEAQISGWRDWYKTASENDAARETELQELRAKVSGSPTPTPTPAPATGLTQKQIEEREGRMINIVKQGMRLASRHAAKFGEELDVDAIEKIAVARGCTLDIAYDEYVKPRVEAAAAAANTEALKKARDEGVQEGLSKRDIPGEAERGNHLIFRKPVSAGETDPSKLTDSQRRDNFANVWNESARAAK